MNHQVVRQHSEEDCGAACIASISKFYGKNFTLNRVREAVGTGERGTTLLGLRRGANSLGFNARSVKASLDSLDQIENLPLPAIIHWQGYHWVVLYGKRGKRYVIADPAVGLRYLEKHDLSKAWSNGVMLLLEPDATRFSLQTEDKTSGFSRFLKRTWPYRGILLQGLLLNLCLGILALTSPFLLQILTDDVLIRGDMQLLNRVAVAVCVMHLVSSSLQFLQGHLVTNFAQRLELGLVLEFGRTILRLPLSYYESRRSGEIVSRLEDIQEVNQLVAGMVVSLPSQFFIALVSIGIMLFYSRTLTIAAIFIAALMTGSTILFLPALQQKIRGLMVLSAENQGVLVETFKGALTLKTTNSEHEFWEEFQVRFGRLANFSLSTNHIGVINSTFSGLVSSIGSIALLWLGSSLVIRQELTIGMLLAFNSMNGNFTGFIASLIGFVDEFTRSKTAVQRLSEVIDATPESPDSFHKPWADIAPNADIVCRDLTFHHPGRVDVLDGLNLTFPGAKAIALIGKSGCGKSTLAKLIASLYLPQSGHIRCGIYNLQDLSLESLRQQIVLVPQDAHFWSRPIIENFRLGYPNIPFEKIVRACQISRADEFISQLPDGYQTVLGEFGANLSGGQRQRLAIARAIVNDPPILILDESTGALDPVSEADVLDQLLIHRQGKTTIFISHRPQVVRRADWIVMLDAGQLQCQGSPEELAQKPGQHLSFINEGLTKCKELALIS